MNKILVAIVVLALVLGGLYWFFQGSSTAIISVQDKENTETVAASPEAVLEEKVAEPPSNNLFELKNSIQGIIDDSVQEEIQQAVESKMNKSEEAQNK